MADDKIFVDDLQFFVSMSIKLKLGTTEHVTKRTEEIPLTKKKKIYNIHTHSDITGHTLLMNQ